mmetsp:Transcript_28022/g.56467  ORF Transcript_28022/g.56467 Transcript_28022/m.56467 type:complete len:149 (+) Transcript_28022:2191-2637(+)
MPQVDEWTLPAFRQRGTGTTRRHAVPNCCVCALVRMQPWAQHHEQVETWMRRIHSLACVCEGCFDTSTHSVHGVFEASAPGALQIDPHVRAALPYPAQVRFHVVQELRALSEAEVAYVFCWNGLQAVDALVLSEAQVSNLMSSFLRRR